MAEKLHNHSACPDGPGHDAAGSGGVTDPTASLPTRGRKHGLPIVVTRGGSREYFLTNRQKAYFCGETGTARTRNYRGLTVELHKFIEGWDLVVGDRPASVWSLRNAVVLPQSMTRTYVADGTTETVFLADDENLLLVSYDSNWRGQASFVPRIDIRSIWEEVRPEYDVRWESEEGVLCVRRSDHPSRTQEQDWPVWLAIACDRPVTFDGESSYRETTYERDSARRSMASATPFVPGRLTFELEGEESFAATVTIAIAVGDTQAEAKTLALRGIRDELSFYDAKMRRVCDLLDRVGVACADSDLAYALSWATASVDALIMNQMGVGIFAGLHWFPNYWGRDTFISLPGACLCRGEFEVAREVLRTCAGLQNTDESDTTYGRIPNLAMPGEVYYNTTDGTWWFVREALEYVRCSGDVEFAAEILPAVERAIVGALLHRVGDDLLLRHGDAETWMDAAGENGPWSPRGDRAVEVQVLWREALLAGARLAEIAAAAAVSSGGEGGEVVNGVTDDRAERWRGLADRIAESFRSAFWNSEKDALYDRLLPDGTGDRRDRPNQAFALSLPDDVVPSADALPDDSEPPARSELLTCGQRDAVLDRLMATCVLPHGVASLSPDDPGFHPVHLDLDRYHFDEAYHNGDVWVWLTGPVVTALVRGGRVAEAWKQTRVLRDIFFNEGAAGTLPELRNGRAPERGENVAGTVSQAWSLAEFLRNFYQDYLGLRPDMTSGRLDLTPALPPGLSWVSCPVRLGSGTASVFFRTGDAAAPSDAIPGEHGKPNAGGPRGVYRIAAGEGLPELTVRFTPMVPPGADVQRRGETVEAALVPGSALEFVVEPDGDDWRTTVSSM